jgi:hypothetical protein
MDVTEDAIRKWISGHNEINLVDFFRLCVAMKADPLKILFGRSALNDEQRNMLADLIRNNDGDGGSIPAPRKRPPR